MNIVLEQIEEELKYLEEFPLNTTTGTEEVMQNYHKMAVETRNAFVNKKIKYYTEFKNLILQNIQDRYDKLVPKDSSANYTELNKKIESFKKILKYRNEFNDVYEKLDFDKFVSNINDTDVTNLWRVNSLIDRIFDIFKNASVELTIDDFDYSVFSKKYMEVYLEKRNSDTYADDMINIFNKLYWECPNILTHVKLNTKYLYRKYEKQLNDYYQQEYKKLLESHNITSDKIFHTYNELCRQQESQEEKDTYLLTNKFLSEELNINDYLEDSSQRQKTFDSFFIDKTFDELDDTKKEEFFRELHNLKHIVVELTNYNKYRELLKDLVKRYQKKDTYKGIYQTKLKDATALEKQRETICSELNTTPKKKGLFSFLHKKKKQKDEALLKVELNDIIKKIDATYLEANDAKINEMIANKLNDASTINDGLELIVSFYPYFKTLYSKLNADQKDFDYLKEYVDLFFFVYNTNNTFIRKLKLNDKQEINDLICEKYKILNLNITKDQLENGLSDLEKNVDYVNLVNNINNSDINFDTIKFLVDYNKIVKTSEKSDNH